MKVRVIAEDNNIISNMMMMMISGGFSYGGFSCSYILRSYFGCMPSSSPSPSSPSSSPPPPPPSSLWSVSPVALYPPFHQMTGMVKRIMPWEEIFQGQVERGPIDCLMCHWTWHWWWPDDIPCNPWLHNAYVGGWRGELEMYWESWARKSTAENKQL